MGEAEWFAKSAELHGRMVDLLEEVEAEILVEVERRGR